MPAPDSIYRGFVRVLAATSAALAAVTTASLMLQYSVADTAGDRGVLAAVMVLNLLGAPAAAALCLALAWRSWNREDARSLATFLAMAAFVLAADGLWNLLGMMGVPEWAASTAELSIPLCALAGMAAMLRFSCTFPRPLAPAELAPEGGGSRARRLLAAAQRGSADAAAVRRACAWAAALLVLAPHAVSLAAAAWGQPFALLGLVKYVLLAMVVGSMAVSAANLRAGYRVADAEGRRRVFWVLEGFLLATAVAVLASVLKLAQDVTGYTPPLRFWYGLAMMAAFTALIVCLAIAMFYAGALDPALAIRRTAVAGLVGLAMVVLFATLEQALQGWLGGQLGLSDRAGGVATGVVVGLAFEPVRARTAAWVERVLAPAGEPVPAVAPPRPEPA